jgi:hypothetical protein
MDQILVYPAFNPRYYLHYLEALQAVVGRARLTFTTAGFPKFGTDCLALRIGRDPEHRIYIHADDMPGLDPEGLAWCDSFGKVNLDTRQIPEEHAHKIVSMGPTFPFRTSGRLQLTWWGLITHFRGRGICEPFARHMALYRGLYTFRFHESAYRPSPSRSDYIFFNASIWEREPEANSTRARFIDACLSIPGIEFEGGLSPRDSARGTKGWRAPGFEKYIVGRYNAAEYLEKTRVSAVALNNPAYLDCHSWRLAENMALGKAIISTPLRRAVPAPTVHGEHIHFVDGSVESFREAISVICGDDAYRRHLEQGARSYYDRHLIPEKVMLRVLQKGGVQVEANDRESDPSPSVVGSE